jgi:ADP-ribose pyrophosphatase YjhB (NUDIX family)
VGEEIRVEREIKLAVVTPKRILRMIDERQIPLTRAEEAGSKQIVIVRAAARIAVVVQWPEGYKCLFVQHQTKGLELPGGALEDGETAEQASRRELQEEAGVELLEEHQLTLITMTPIKDHRGCNWLDIVYATKVTPPQLITHLEAELPVRWLSTDEIKQEVNPKLSSYLSSLTALKH